MRPTMAGDNAPVFIGCDSFDRGGADVKADCDRFQTDRIQMACLGCPSRSQPHLKGGFEKLAGSVSGERLRTDFPNGRHFVGGQCLSTPFSQLLGEIVRV